MTIQIAGKKAVLADGRWRSADAGLLDLLNAHLRASQLEVGAHLPPGDRELELARLACTELDGAIIGAREPAMEQTGCRDGQSRFHGRRRGRSPLGSQHRLLHSIPLVRASDAGAMSRL